MSEPASPPSDWVPPRRTLIVAATPRCGSTWLGGLIGGTGQLGRPREWFGGPELASAAFVLAAAREARAKSVTDNGIAGVKLFPDVLEAILRHIRFSQWFPGEAWVHLERRDTLGQAISLWRAHSSGAWHKYADARREAADLRAAGAMPPYDPAAINRYLEQVVAWQADWRAFFARTGITPLTLVYEDALVDPDATIRRVAALLDVDLPAAPIGDASKYAVQRDDATLAIRARFQADYGDPDRPIRTVLRVGHSAKRRREPVVAPRTIGNLVRLLRGRTLKVR